MSKNDDELNEFIDEMTDGAYNPSCVEVIFKVCQADVTMVFVCMCILFTIYF